MEFSIFLKIVAFKKLSIFLVCRDKESPDRGQARKSQVMLTLLSRDLNFENQFFDRILPLECHSSNLLWHQEWHWWQGGWEFFTTHYCCFLLTNPISDVIPENIFTYWWVWWCSELKQEAQHRYISLMCVAKASSLPLCFREQPPPSVLFKHLLLNADMICQVLGMHRLVVE